ncbi:DUF3106 domain-containing protein [Herbaspirillum sp. alder98]|uniref:DUF3106 domain-containing protein n=1 Tax=Herbaspirillum sp. alder98 TaxID=2913096 RepID=UPI001CD8E664|nr:DUF3106 domain-containing protein [Herbaspirillum sp. alder98]MCA1325411.1 DUF3106 domain-containing protein [Herbaspirillum sp. alder98]
MRNTTGSPVKATRRTPIALGVALAVLAGGLWSAWSCAQGTAPAATPALPAVQIPAKAGGVVKQPVKRTDSKLAWASLAPKQQAALEPLAGEWPKMNETHKEKWLVISKKFDQMKPEEQQRLHERMRDWAKLTPAQRSAARTNYARAKKLDAEEKSEQWHKYQQLTAEQKKKLAQAKLPKRVAKLPTAPSSAAPAIQLPAEALERPVPTPAMPVISPGAQAASLPAAAPANLPMSGAITPVSSPLPELPGNRP